MLTREFLFIIDPRCLERISAFPPAPFLNAAARLAEAQPAVKIQLAAPSFFKSEDSRLLRQYRKFISDIAAPLGDGRGSRTPPPAKTAKGGALPFSPFQSPGG